MYNSEGKSVSHQSFLICATYIKMATEIRKSLNANLDQVEPAPNDDDDQFLSSPLTANNRQLTITTRTSSGIRENHNYYTTEF